jgi:chromosome segregation ATPase
MEVLMENILKAFEEKISIAVQKVKTLKEEKDKLENRVKELEGIIKAKDIEIERLSVEKTAIKSQIEKLLSELESIET